MNRLSHFESAIIGFFVGVVNATYLVFVISSKGFLGTWISWLSLKPLLDIFIDVHHVSLLISFVFFILVYVFYSLIISRILRVSSVTLRVFFIALCVAVLGLVVYDQVVGSKGYKINTPDEFVVVAPLRQKNSTPQSYFGEFDARADLNNDQKDDVVFLIPRIQKGKEPLYYLTAALASKQGYEGLNLIFLGGNVDPKQINVDNGLVSLEYKDRSVKNNLDTKKMYIKLIDQQLYQVNIVSGANGTTTEIVSGN